MIPLHSEEIKGNWATLLLPINGDDTIDYRRLTSEIDTLISMGVDGIYSNGTSGEFYNQTEEEFDRISSVLAEKCNAAKMPFQIGVSHMSPIISMARLKRIIPLEPSAIQVILPDWFPVSLQEAIHFLQRMGEIASPIGLVLYNPPHAKRVFSPQELGQIKKAVPSLVGLKIGDGDKRWYADMRQYVPNISVFVPGHRLASGFQLGADGAYSNVACLNPAAAQRWYNQMKTDIQGALDLELRIQKFMQLSIRPLISDQYYSNMAVDKLLAEIGGWADIGTRLRWPYRWIPKRIASKLRPIAQEIIPEFFLNTNLRNP